MDDIERRRKIVTRVLAGEPQNKIAKDIGVSRQAVNQLWKKYQERGEEAITAPSRGRMKETDILSSEETQRMVEWVKEHKPKDIGENKSKWTLILVKRAIYAKLRKRVKIPIAHTVFHSAFPDHNSKFEGGAALAPVRRRGRPGRKPKPKLDASAPSNPEKPAPKAPSTAEGHASAPFPDLPSQPTSPDEETEDGFPTVADMARMNQETLRTPEGREYLRREKAGPGERIGKKAKGTRSPRQKPKRRKNK